MKLELRSVLWSVLKLLYQLNVSDIYDLGLVMCTSSTVYKLNDRVFVSNQEIKRLAPAGVKYPKHWYRALGYVNYGFKLAKVVVMCVS